MNCLELFAGTGSIGKVWNNFGFEGNLCNKECGSYVNGRHISNCGHPNKNYIKGMDNFINTSLKERYRIPHKLIKGWINKMYV